MKKIRIAVDIMSGDNLPEILLQGVLSAVNEDKNIEIILVGKQELIDKELCKAKHKRLHNLSNISMVPSNEIIEMSESPAKACKQKPNASVMIAAKLVSENKADAYISPGNSGATMAASLIHLKRINGIKRPAIVSTMPTLNAHTVLLDVGANVDVTPECLLQFGIMGSIYAEKIFDIKFPKVGLLNIGEEEQKGNTLTLEAFELLKQSKINFVGNVEGKNINDGSCDVVVCDGFVGNIVLKVSEGVASVLIKFFKQSVKKNVFRKLAAILFLPVLSDLKKKVDAKEYGGALLLGTNGITIIAHGNSNALAIKNAIKFATFCVKNNLNEEIKKSIIKKIWSKNND
ncbi:MAG: phosphate acyltransferase PlsX [Elusimicrobiota bacterium]|jgi:glycerol-3-phosphate acyltransferase PlsX|nr:phosphate acyltransferase PlsX [Elusimicrobiota bacterium]